MGSDYNTSGAQSPSAMLQAYQQYLPNIMQAIGTQIPNMATQQAIGAIGATGMENAANLGQMQQFALPEAQIGQQVQNANALAGAQTNLNQLTGPGGQAASAASALNQTLNPAYTQSANSAGKGASELINGITLNGLSPGEQNSVERSLNQTNTANGNLGLNNPMNTISNALNFGGAYNNKLGILSNATNTASNAANATASNGNFNAVGTALGQPQTSTQSNFGSGQFVNTTPQSSASSTSNAFNASTGLLGNMTSANNAAQQAGASMANATSPASYLGTVCCFIFLEAYNGRLPKCVRKGRDAYYKVNPDIAVGYRRMACWLVPLMRSNSFVRWFVNTTMITPITKHLQHPKANCNKRITHLWLKLWSITGKEKEEVTYRKGWVYRYV